MGAAYVKYGLYERPTLGIAVALRLDGAGTRRVGEARIAVGCVSPRPIRVAAAEAHVTGVDLRDLEDAAGTAAGLAATAVDADDDLHGSADYKREMVAVFVQRAFRIAAARAQGAEPTMRFPYAVVA
jgi:carbon-monoxide dehydrogenase medium subunit